MGVVYKVTNSKNGKVYIGKTNKTIDVRRKQHERDARKPKYIFHRAIRKYGQDSFDWQILHNSDNEDDLLSLEELEISEHDSTNPECGYNMVGGDLSPSSTARNAENRVVYMLDRLISTRKCFYEMEQGLLSGSIKLAEDGKQYRGVPVDSMKGLDRMIMESLFSLGRICANGKA
jgi:hypothetical protein